MRTRRFNGIERQWQVRRVVVGGLVVVAAAVWTAPELAGAEPKVSAKKTTSTTVGTDAQAPGNSGGAGNSENSNAGGNKTDTGSGGGSTDGGGTGGGSTGGGTTTGGGGGGGGSTGGTGGSSGGSGTGGGSTGGGTTTGGGGGGSTGGGTGGTTGTGTGTGGTTTGGSPGGANGAGGSSGSSQDVGSTSGASAGGSRAGSIGRRARTGSRPASVSVPAVPGGAAVAALRGPDNAAQATVRGIQSGQGMPTAGGANLYAQLAAAPLPSDSDDLPANPYIVFVILTLFGVGIALTGRGRTGTVPMTAVRRRHPMLAG